MNAKPEITGTQKARLKAALLKLLKSLAADVRNAIVAVVVVGLLLAYGGLLYLSKTALSYTILILQTPTPLWASIALVLLCGVYIRLRVVRHRALVSSQNKSVKDYRTIHFPVMKFKWKTYIRGDSLFEVDRTPLCADHDLTFILKGGYYQCPEVLWRRCDNKIPFDHLDEIFDIAKELHRQKSEKSRILRLRFRGLSFGVFENYLTFYSPV